mmetsp:Transcript_11136/g.28732  ORF Transcript_11136/g.28732 Transcript_11136/m.28732 type:complete len:205 (-) Transcript_11136:80-694(-)
MPEFTQEAKLQDLQREYNDKRRAVQTIKRHYESVVQWRMLDLLDLDIECRPVMRSGVVPFAWAWRGPVQGDTLDCEVVKVLDEREALVKQWYADVHGIKVTDFVGLDRSSWSRPGDVRAVHMEFEWGSEEKETSIRADIVRREAHKFDSNIDCAMQLIKLKLNDDDLVKKVKAFIPSYTEHQAHVGQQIAKLQERMARTLRLWQ